MTTEQDLQILKQLRKEIFIVGFKGGLAHLAPSFSSLEILYALYVKGVLRLDPCNPDWKDRDRFILSKGHAGLALYSVMVQAGLMSRKDFHSYLQPGTHIGGEPCMRDLKGIETSTGSLGHGLSVGVGMAIALKANHSDSKTYVLLGDGECQEGSVWEAAMSAAAFQLDNLTVILDCNGIQKMDSIVNTMGFNNWKEKWIAFGFAVEEVDGHDVEALTGTLLRPCVTGHPRLIIAHTIKGKGVSIMENNPAWHFKLPGRREMKYFKEELSISDSELE